LLAIRVVDDGAVESALVVGRGILEDPQTYGAPLPLMVYYFKTV
jgi:hypothetical protein